MMSTSNLESNEYHQINQPVNANKQSRQLLLPQAQHQSKLSDLRRRNMSVISPSALQTEQSERSSYSRGSKTSLYLPSPFEASQLLRRKIGGLARRNLALERTKNNLLE